LGFFAFKASNYSSLAFAGNTCIQGSNPYLTAILRKSPIRKSWAFLLSNAQKADIRLFN